MTPQRRLTSPYQPLLLRLLHGITALCLLAAIATAYWTYDVYDGRWGRIPLPEYQEIEGIHGTFGLWTLLIFPALVIYAFHRGYRRLLQPDSLNKLTRLGTPLWWYTLHRGINTVSLLALTFALFSGKMMDETWLPDGELDHAWYYAHLGSWVVMVVTILLHWLLNAKVGGSPLLLSMLTWQFRAQDSPRLWSTHVTQWWSAVRQGEWQMAFPAGKIMTVLELTIGVSLLLAWILPLVNG